MSTKTSSPRSKDNLIEYAKRNLIGHLYEARHTDAYIEDLVRNIPKSDPLRAHFVEQYLQRLPETQRKLAEKRLKSKK